MYAQNVGKFVTSILQWRKNRKSEKLTRGGNFSYIRGNKNSAKSTVTELFFDYIFI